MKSRDFRRREKREEIPRGQRVYEAIMKGVCVDCSHELVEVGPLDADYQGKNHVRCPSCEWQAQWGI